GYLNKIHVKEYELISLQKTQLHQTVINSTEDRENIDPLFINPYKVIMKERPRKAEHHNKTILNSTLKNKKT
ncbi:12973_t:CDS:1, partial [Cetraspora pellucida]